MCQNTSVYGIRFGELFGGFCKISDLSGIDYDTGNGRFMERYGQRGFIPSRGLQHYQGGRQVTKRLCSSWLMPAPLLGNRQLLLLA